MNYLLWPHLHFSGTYIADVSTINNNPENYNTEKVMPTNLDESSRNWNPKGTGEWSVNGVVTQVCYPNGTCIDSDDEKSQDEPLVGALVFGMYVLIQKGTLSNHADYSNKTVKNFHI